jgi:hypothetical protein
MPNKSHAHGFARRLKPISMVSVIALAVAGIAPAQAQSSVREQVRDTVRAAEAELSEAERLRSNADTTRTAALLLDNAGEIAGAVWDGAATPFNIVANTANWSAGKQEELGLLLAAKAVDRLNDVPTEQLSTEMIRAIVTTNPDLAALTNSVGIEKVREMVMLQRSDLATFQARVASAQQNHDKLLASAKEDLDAIRSGQAVTQEMLGNQDAALALMMLAVSENADHLTEATGKILSSQERIAKLQQLGQSETRSGLAAILRQGASAEAAVNRTHSLAALQMGMLEQNKALLDGLDVRTRSIQDGVNFLQAQQFRSLSPNEQLAILNDPSHPAFHAMFDGMPAPTRNKAVNLYVEQAEAAALKQEVVTSVSTTMDVLNGINALGTTLGWEFTERKDYQNGMKALNLAAGLGMAYVTSNPAMALSSLNAAFASPSTAPSPGEAQILAALGLMDKKLDDLLEGQTKIRADIEQSRREAQEMHQQTMYRFDLIDQEFADLKQLSASAVRAIVSLSSFNSQRVKCDNVRSNFPDSSSLAALRANVQSAPLFFSDCAALVESIWTLPQAAKAAPHFFLEMASETYVDSTATLGSRLLSFNKVQYAPLQKLLWSAHGITWSAAGKPSSTVAYDLMASLAEPAANIDNLRSKALRYKARSSDLQRWANERGIATKIGGLFGTVLHPDHLVEAIANLEAMVAYSDVRDHRQVNYALYDLADIKSSSAALDLNSRALEGQFNTALSTLNFAIAQQALLSGDFLIPNISDLVFSTQVSELRNELIEALNQNPVLARNVLLFWIDSELEKNRLLPERLGPNGQVWPRSLAVDGRTNNWAYNLEYYDQLLAAGTVGSPDVCSAAKLNWKCLLPAGTVTASGKITLSTTRKDSAGKVVTVASYQIPLPSSSDLEARQLIIHDDLAKLLSVRRDLYQLAEKMNIRKQLPAVDEIWILPTRALLN